MLLLIITDFVPTTNDLIGSCLICICLFFLFRPDTQSYIEKLKREEQERAKGQTEDKRSFLAKYVSIENIQGQIFIETN